MSKRDGASFEFDPTDSPPFDAGVLAWLKAGGRGYQTRINAILREAMPKEAAASSE